VEAVSAGFPTDPAGLGTSTLASARAKQAVNTKPRKPKGVFIFMLEVDNGFDLEREKGS